jgi:hypothetical protein
MQPCGHRQLELTRLVGFHPFGRPLKTDAGAGQWLGKLKRYDPASDVRLRARATHGEQNAQKNQKVDARSFEHDQGGPKLHQ